MKKPQRQHLRLAAYRQLYAAICSLSDTLYEEALAVCENDRDAAFAASCALVSRLSREGTPAAQHGLLGRLEALPRSSARPARRPASAST
ncbi:MAG: hypothetical protein QM765_49285 [Myxococcales bacterium]